MANRLKLMKQRKILAKLLKVLNKKNSRIKKYKSRCNELKKNQSMKQQQFNAATQTELVFAANLFEPSTSTNKNIGTFAQSYPIFGDAAKFVNRTVHNNTTINQLPYTDYIFGENVQSTGFEAIVASTALPTALPTVLLVETNFSGIATQTSSEVIYDDEQTLQSQGDTLAAAAQPDTSNITDEHSYSIKYCIDQKATTKPRPVRVNKKSPTSKYKCADCVFTTNKKHTFVVHQAEFCKNPPIKDRKCNYCGKMFTRRALRVHINQFVNNKHKPRGPHSNVSLADHKYYLDQIKAEIA